MTLASSLFFLFSFSLLLEKEYCKQNPLISVLMVSQSNPLSSNSAYSIFFSSIILRTPVINSESSNKLALNFQNPRPLFL